MSKFPLLFFFAIAYVIVWVFAGISLVGGLTFSHPVITVGFFLGAFAPTFAALIVAGAEGGWKEIGRLLRGFLAWKTSPLWYLAAFLPVLGTIAVALVFGSVAPGFRIEWGSLPFILLVTFLPGPLSEETGWRGFALPRLLKRMEGLPAALLLGFLWAMWHLPLFLIPGAPQYGQSLPLFALLMISITVIQTWIWRSSSGRLPLMIIVHWAMNLSGTVAVALLGLVPARQFYDFYALAMAIVALAIVIFTGPKLYRIKEGGSR